MTFGLSNDPANTVISSRSGRPTREYCRRLDRSRARSLARIRRLLVLHQARPRYFLGTSRPLQMPNLSVSGTSGSGNARPKLAHLRSRSARHHTSTPRSIPWQPPICHEIGTSLAMPQMCGYVSLWLIGDQVNLLSLRLLPGRKADDPAECCGAQWSLRRQRRLWDLYVEAVGQFGSRRLMTQSGTLTNI
jgi:hypothetical protein